MNINSKNGNKNKIFVIFVALIFLGSMAGALLYSTGTPQTFGELPASKITAGVSDAQKQLILFGSQTNPEDRYVLVTATIPKICDSQCSDSKRVLEQMVSAYAPAIYLSEIQSAADSSLDVKVLMESYADKKEMSAFNASEVENFVCGNTIYLVNECVLRRMELGASNGNKTEGNEIRGTEAGENSSASTGTTVSGVSNSTGYQNTSNISGQQDASNTTKEQNASNSTAK